MQVDSAAGGKCGRGLVKPWRMRACAEQHEQGADVRRPRRVAGPQVASRDAPPELDALVQAGLRASEGPRTASRVRATVMTCGESPEEGKGRLTRKADKVELILECVGRHAHLQADHGQDAVAVVGQMRRMRVQRAAVGLLAEPLLPGHPCSNGRWSSSLGACSGIPESLTRT